MDLRFQSPGFLLLLLLLPVLAWLLGRAGRAAALRFPSAELARPVSRGRRSAAGRFLWALHFLGLGLLVIALARPQRVEVIQSEPSSGIDIVLAVDISQSMLALDFQVDFHRDTRLEAAKVVIADFIEQRPNDRIGMVAFAGRPYLVSPLTLNHGWLKKNLERLYTGLIDEGGTAIGDAISMSVNRLRDLEAPTRVIILLTDGENNQGELSPVTAAETAAAFNAKVYTIAVGNEDRVWYPRHDSEGRVYRRQDGSPIRQGIVQFPVDEETLREVAEITRARFYRARDTRELGRIYDEIDELETSEVEIQTYAEYHELFFWPLLAGLSLIGLEQLLAQTRFRRLP